MKRALVAVALSLLGGPAHGFAAGLTVIPWGITDKGELVEKVTVENDLHMRASYIAYGATITALNVPDRQGKTRNVLLSLPDLPPTSIRTAVLPPPSDAMPDVCHMVKSR